jgi:hypothetical protein
MGRHVHATIYLHVIEVSWDHCPENQAIYVKIFKQL